MLNMSDYQLMMIGSLWNAKNISLWDIICVQSEEQVAREFRSDDGTATITAVRMLPKLMVFNWCVDRKRGLAVNNPPSIHSIYEWGL